jgi:uncharacterized membrane protein
MIKSTEQEEQLKEEITQIPKDKKIKSIEENRLFRKNMDLALKDREKIARDLLIANKMAKLNAEQTKSEKETENISICFADTIVEVSFFDLFLILSCLMQLHAFLIHVVVHHIVVSMVYTAVSCF